MRLLDPKIILPTLSESDSPFVKYFTKMVSKIVSFFLFVTTALSKPLNNSEYAPKALDTMSTDPEIHMDTLEIIYHWGYKGESHIVETADGYLLEMHRIPFGKKGPGNGTRPVIFLQHGLECSSSNWVTNLPYQSAGFLFADAGYDVWMGNFRGNTYSKRHVSLSTKSKAFWAFSWDQMAKYDLDAMINRVLEVTGEKQVYYMGHSMGTLTAFAKFSKDQEFAKKIKKFFALGPVSTVGHLPSGLINLVAKFAFEIKFLLGLIGEYEFLPNDLFMKLAAKYVCGDKWADELICTNILFLIAGPDSHQLNQTRVPVYISHTPAGTSTQNMLHFAQMANSGQFQKYNFGRIKNRKIYGQNDPPLYHLENVQVPTYLFWGDLDTLADPQDVKNMIPKLKNLTGNYEYPQFNHLDFIWGLRAAPEIYKKVLDIIEMDNM